MASAAAGDCGRSRFSALQNLWRSGQKQNTENTAGRRNSAQSIRRVQPCIHRGLIGGNHAV